MDIDIIKNITFEHSDTDRLRILDTRNWIRTDTNPSRLDRIRIRSKNIRNIYIPNTKHPNKKPVEQNMLACTMKNNASMS